MLSKFPSIIIVIIVIIVLRQSPVFPSPTPKSVFKTCYDSNRFCFETDLSTKLDPSTIALGLDNLCPPGKTLPQIYGEVEQKALQEYLATLPRYVKYLAPIGLKIKYRQWSEIIKVTKTDSLSSKNYLMMKLDKTSIALQAEDGDAKHPFGCVTKGPCPCQSSSKIKDPLCFQLDACCLQINNNNNNKLTYYEAIKYCNIQNNASLLTFSTLSSNQKVLTSLLPNVQELWAGETRVSLNWMNKNSEPVIYTHWQPGYPKHKAVFAYLKYDDKDGGWMTFQDVDLSSDDDDAEKKYIAVCVGEEKPSGVEKPSGKANPDNNISNSNNSSNNDDDNNNSFKPLKIGLGLGLSLCLLLVSVLVKVLVVCLRYRKRRLNEFKGHLGKTPSIGTISSSASSTESRRTGNYHLSENSYNNYVTRDNFSNFNNGARSKPLDSCHGHPVTQGQTSTPSNDNNNRIYEDIGPYEIPDGAPIVEHIYKAIRKLPEEYQRQLPQLPPERSVTLPQVPPQPQYIQMRRNSYMEVIG